MNRTGAPSTNTIKQEVLSVPCFAAIDHAFQKRNHAEQRKENMRHKEQDEIRNKGFHRKRDAYKRTMRHKGPGRFVKEKGRTMETAFCANSRCAKGWENHFLGNSFYGESVNSWFIWDNT